MRIAHYLTRYEHRAVTKYLETLTFSSAKILSPDREKK